MEKQPNFRMCFRDVFRVRRRPARGAIGLLLAFQTAMRAVRGPVSAQAEHRGYPGHLRGGIISTMLNVFTQIPVHAVAIAV